MSEPRLRSEDVPSVDRSARVRESRARAERERAAMAADFRSRLTGELVIDGSAAQEWLILSAVSAAVEITVLNQRFIRCYAGPAAMGRLSNARAQLSRTLRMLGVTAKPKDARSGSALADYLKQTYGEAEAEETNAAGR